MNRLQKLQNKRAEKLKTLKAIPAAAFDEDRDITAEEDQQYNDLKAEIEKIDGEIAREKEILEMEESTAVEVPDANRQTQITAHDRREDDPTHGFRTYGEFCVAVMAASRPGGHVDERLNIGAAPTTYGNEGSGEDGAYLIPPEYSGRVREHTLEDDAILPLTDNTPVSGNGMTFPADETTPWGSDGIRAYWESEASQATQTKPKLKERTLRLRKLFALVPVTDELMADAPALGNFLMRKTGQSIRYKTNDALYNGSGAGMPLGIANAGALVTVAKEGSQSADTVVAGNVAKMYARNPNAARSYWHCNPDVLPELFTMTLGDKPIWTPPTEGFKQAPGGLLFGRPVIPLQNCATLGDKLDISFVDWQSYATITKQGGIDFATSMHLWFDYGVNAFRAILRVDGQPWQDNAISPAKGSNKLSPFVTLAART